MRYHSHPWTGTADGGNFGGAYRAPLAERPGVSVGGRSGTLHVHLCEQGRPQGAGFSAGDQQSLATLILARSQRLPFDPEGRIVLPEKFTMHAHISESAAFVGLGPTFQIWEPNRFAEHEAALLDRARRQGMRMPPLGSLISRRRQ